MNRESKYIKLTKYLESCGSERICLSFDEINNLCRNGLTQGAYRQRSFWANTLNTAFARGWLNAGYVVEKVDLGDSVIFRWNPERAKNPGAARKAGKKGNVLLYQNNHIVLSENELTELIISGESFKNRLKADPNGRYRSWEHCYNFFANNHIMPNEQIKDQLSLNLAFYLASWGMYRGSSFLLKKDYLFHKPAIELLVSPEWSNLWHPTAELLSKQRYAQQVIELSNELNKVYCLEKGSDLTDTLTTKILLGTLGCVPAYDINFKAGARSIKRGLATFSSDSIIMLAQLYLENFDKFESLRLSCNQHGVEYPAMKILDMCFFTYGLRYNKK
jgi:hypothetical protein